MSNRRQLIPLALILAAGAALPALAQTAPAPPSYNVSWSALDPGNDWAAEMIRAVFPVSGNPCNGGAQSAACTGAAATVIGDIIGRLTGFVMALAMSYVSYLAIWHVFRAGETANLLAKSMTSFFVVRVGFAAIMMFPAHNGFSVGQAAVVQISQWGIGMGKSLYTYALKAIGPDAMVIASPIVPGTKNIVLKITENELCRAFVNAATGNRQVAPAPTPQRISGMGALGTVTYAYNLSPGNQIGDPACGTISVREPSGGSEDLLIKHQQILDNIIAQIRPVAESVADNYFKSKQTSALTPLLSMFSSATQSYQQQLTQAASEITQKIRDNAKKTAQDARSGKLALSADNTTTNLSTIGWAGAGAYYLTFAQMTGQTLSLLNNLPVVSGPTYNGFSRAIATDLAPLITASSTFLGELRTYVNTADGDTPPTGNADTFANSTAQEGGSMIERVFRRVNLSEPFVNFIARNISPTQNQWSDPFGGLITLGQYLINASIAAFGLAIVASSGSVQAASTLWNFVTLNWGAAAASAALTSVADVFKALLTVIFLGLLALLVPGLMIAYVLPLIPWAIWTAGVTGYLILVLEAVIAVPLMMLAHMTFEGDGLHGRAIQVYEILFNVLFRPALMLIGLFAAYFVFASVSWLIRATFGVAITFVLAKGWFVTNLIGLVVLLNVFVLMHVVVALKAFGLISLIPHHVPKMIGFSPANRVDMDEFAKAAAWSGADAALAKIDEAAHGTLRAPGQSSGEGVKSPRGALPAPRKQIASASENSKKTGGVDSTLAAQTDLGEHNKDA